MVEIRIRPPVTDALAFWRERIVMYPQLAPLAEDLVSASASQAFVERIFSVCGMLTAGRRNRMENSLQCNSSIRMASGPSYQYPYKRFILISGLHQFLYMDIQSNSAKIIGI